MKKALLIAVAILFALPLSAQAKPEKKSPKKPNHVTINKTYNKTVNNTVNNKTEVTNVTEVTEVTNKTEVTQVIENDSNYEQFDYGLYLDLTFYQTEDKNIEIGIKNSWEVDRDEFTSLLGAKVNVWSLFKDKE